MMNRPFRVLGIQQIAIGGPDKMRLQIERNHGHIVAAN